MSIRTVELGQVAEINPRGKSRLHGDDVVSFLRMADVDAESGTTSRGEDRSYADVAKGYTQFDNGDLLVAKITPCFENGKIAQARIDHRHGAGSTEFHVIRPDLSRFDARFLLRFLRQPYVRVAGEKRMTGSAGQRRIPTEYLASLEIPDLPLMEQRRIAHLLDSVDALRMKRRRAIALLADLAESIFLDTFGDPAYNPKDWPISTIADLVQSADYGTSEKARQEGDIAVLRMNNVTVGGEIDLRSLKYMDRSSVSDRHLLRCGDILFNRTNSADLVGKSAIYRGAETFAYAGYLVRIRVNHETDPEYVAAFLNTRYAKRILRGMCKSIIGMANINAREMQGIRIPKPPTVLQQRFAEQIRALESLKSIHRSHLVQLGALLSSIEHRAFSGEPIAAASPA